MQTAFTKIRTQVADSISNIDERYAKTATF